MMKPKRLFGTDGVRGHANQFPMTVEIALALGKATATLLRKKEGRHRVVIGKDTRLSCYMFENALIAGLCSMGVDTLMVGPFPTPGIAFITRAYRADAGIMISASHNPYFDNGIKIFDEEGFKLSDHLEEEMEKIIEKNTFERHLPQDAYVGKNKRIQDADGRYVEFAKATFPKGKTLQGLKIVLDCANGAAHRVAPLIFQELDAEVFVYSNEPSGVNINEKCGSLHPELIRKKVLEHKAHCGIALDGDADRVIMVDEKGDIVDGDTILAIAATYFKKNQRLQNEKVVATVMTNLAVVKYLEAQGIKVFLSKVGDRYVIQDMLTHSAFLGGEQSGHLIFLNHNTTGDGMVTALQILKIMLQEKLSLSKLSSRIKKFPQTLLNIAVSKKPPIDTIKSITSAIKRGETTLGDDGRILVRYSGTENLCRVMVEGPKRPQINKIAQEIGKAIKQVIGV